MKTMKRIQINLMLGIVILILSGLVYSGTAYAEENNLNYLEITKYPSKTEYKLGEDLDLSDMEITGYFNNGSIRTISDYEVKDYDKNKLGEQLVILSYQNQTKAFFVKVLPAKVTNIKVKEYNVTSFTLIWDTYEAIQRYEIYRLDETTGTYNYVAFSNTNSITLYYSQGMVHKFRICAVGVIDQTEYRGGFSEDVTVANGPEMVTGLVATQTTEKSISLSWNTVAGATGYLIYRSPVNAGKYSYLGKTDTTSYTDTTPASGTGYQYKVSAYLLEPAFYGTYSAPLDITTNPAKMILTYKAGDGKIRVKWNKVTGATSYDLYMGNDEGDFTLLATLGSLDNSYVLEGLINGNTYSFQATSHREYNGIIYDSPYSDILLAGPSPVEATSTVAKLFVEKSDFENSSAYTGVEFFGTNVKYEDSIILPGLITTNVGGFASKSMCPQGLTFAKNYLLITAYDLAAEENSVVYVIDKKEKNLLTTLILPNKAHVGGISYDGSNIWITVGTKISSIPFSKLKEAAKEGKPYSYIEFSSECETNVAASFVTYYDEKLWIGSYNELNSTNMFSYTIQYEDMVPVLVKENTILMPNRMQGIAFTKEGDLILSRSCQLYKGLRGYMRQLEVYRPDFSEMSEDGVILLGECINTIEMPSMNEEIAIDGSYLYVNFESAAFDKASYQVDRICAFDLSSILGVNAAE